MRINLSQINFIKSLAGAVTIFLPVIIMFFPINLKAQTIWYDKEKGNSLSLEVNLPVTPADSIFGNIFPGLNSSSGSIFLAGRYAVKKNIILVGDIPVARGDIDDSLYTGGAQTILGNPYLGAEFYLPKSPLFFELGFRIPIVPDDKGTASLAGIFSDFDRAEAFIKDIFPVYGAINYETISDSKILFKARGGINLWFNTNSLGVDTDPFVSVDYSLQTGYIDERIHIIAGADGRYDLSSGPKNPEKVTLLQYGLSITVPYKNIRPGISFRVPGNNITEKQINYVIGLNFGYIFD